MKKVLVVVLLSSALILVFAGVAMAQLPKIYLEGDVTGLCDAPGQSMQIPILVDDVVDLEAFTAVVVYDRTSVEVDVAFVSSFFDQTTASIVWDPTCYEGYIDGVTGACGLGGSELAVPVSTITPETVALVTITAIPGGPGSSINLSPGSLFPLTFPTSLNGETAFGPSPEIDLGDPITIPGCPTAIGGPLNLQGLPLDVDIVPVLFAVAAVLGATGIFLAYRLRRNDTPVV